MSIDEDLFGTVYGLLGTIRTYLVQSVNMKSIGKGLLGTLRAYLGQSLNMMFCFAVDLLGTVRANYFRSSDTYIINSCVKEGGYNGITLNFMG